MEQVNTVEKSHEQIQLRSLTRNIAKGGAPKRKLSFVDNRPIQQKQVQMKEVIQRKLYKGDGDMKTLIKNQIDLQNKTGDNPDKVTEELVNDREHADPRFFTTVGYEFEFIQLENKGLGSVLQNVVHAELGESTERFDYTRLPFSLETDADETIELVTPPFIIDTLPGTSIPEPDDVQTVSTAMETGLEGIAKSAKNIGEMVGKLGEEGLEFGELKAEIKSENMLGYKSKKLDAKMNHAELEELETNYEQQLDFLEKRKENEIKLAEDKKPRDSIKKEIEEIYKIYEMYENYLNKLYKDKIFNLSIKVNNLSELNVVPSKKGRSIITQVNIAMTADDYLKIKDMPGAIKYNSGIEGAKPFFELRKKLVDALLPYFSSIQNVKWNEGKFKVLIEEIASYLLNTISLSYMDKYRTDGENNFKNEGQDVIPPSKMLPASHVKDNRGVWFKDSIRSLAKDLLEDETMETITAIADKLRNANSIDLTEFSIKQESFSAALASLSEFLMVLANKKDTNEEVCIRVRGLCERGTYYGKFDARPDTYFPSNTLIASPGLKHMNKRLHVVESRHHSSDNIVHELRRLKMQYLLEKMESIKTKDELTAARNEFNILKNERRDNKYIFSKKERKTFGKKLKDTIKKRNNCINHSIIRYFISILGDIISKLDDIITKQDIPKMELNNLLIRFEKGQDNLEKLQDKIPQNFWDEQDWEDIKKFEEKFEKIQQFILGEK